MAVSSETKSLRARASRRSVKTHVHLPSFDVRVGMASGIGVNGGTGRCYSLWLGFTECMKDAAMPADCADNREDYIECLHHRKEIKRMRQVAEEAQKQGQTPPTLSESAATTPSGSDASS